MKTMSLVCNENEWTSYVEVMMKSKIQGIKLVVRMVGWTDVSKLYNVYLVSLTIHI
jgi:hypothetical protein